MTTIAYKDEILAADSKCYIGERRVQDENKIVILNDGSALAVCGKRSEEIKFVRWLNKEVKTKPEAVGVIVIHATPEKIMAYHEEGDDEYSLDGFHTWGSGDCYAVAAMACGKSAKDAIKIAKKFDVYSGGKVNSYKVK